MIRIESLLSARLFLAPQLVGDSIFFISNLGGKLSLYVMDHGGSVPEPLLPPHLALQNPDLVGGVSFKVFPNLSKILLSLDHDGDENYQPMVIPIAGGYPEPAFGNAFDNYRVHIGDIDLEKGIVYLNGESRTDAIQEAFRGDMATGKIEKLAASTYGAYPGSANEDHSRVLIADGYTMGDTVLFEKKQGKPELELVYGVPLEQRKPGQVVPLSGIGNAYYTQDDRGLLLTTALFEDTYGPAYLDFDRREELTPVTVRGLRHHGMGEMEGLQHLDGERYAIYYNIDGVSWVYEARFDQPSCELVVLHTLVGEGVLSNGKLESLNWEKESDRYSLAFSTAISPTQIYTIEDDDRGKIIRHTNERILGIPETHLSAGEDASYTSFDGTRISARLYLPAKDLSFQGPRPVVLYVHGGPQGQERPDFAWFSMPLIQFLTLNGFAVFVPNVRGSTGYGLSYTKQVDRDWGGKDRLDHVHALTEVLPKDSRLDVKRAAVVGRSYGGYMTLTLAGRHPELWSAAADMFGPYSLFTFLERIPPTWKPYFKMAIGDAEIDHEFLMDRSPSTHLHNLACPMLVIQGAHDPRVVEKESADLVESMRKQGKTVEYLMFPNEGHDVLKFENRVACYNAITDFFKKHLMGEEHR